MSQKRKRLTIVMLTILALALLNYIFPHRVKITAPDNAYIAIVNGLAGTHYQITNSEDVTTIIQQLNDLILTHKIRFNHGNNGYMYSINIFAGGDKNIFQLTILGNNKILLDDYVYTANTSPLLELLADIEQNQQTVK